MSEAASWKSQSWLRPNPSERDAAIRWAQFEVYDLNPLRSAGSNYARPSDNLGHHSGVIGADFMSWVLRSWVDIGYAEVHADANREHDDQLLALGWIARAVRDGRWLRLRQDDALAVVSNTALWGSDNAIGWMYASPSEMGKRAAPDEWTRVALDSKEPTPSLHRPFWGPRAPTPDPNED